MSHPYSIDQVRKFLIFVTLYAITLGILAGTFLVEPVPYDGFETLRTVIIIFASVLLTKYFFYMVMSPWYDVWVTLSRNHWRRVRPEYRPLVSVLLPAWNEEVGIIKTIDSLVQSSYENLEIIVVNDGSTDESDRLIREYVTRFSALDTTSHPRKRILYQYQENEGKGGALNQAIAHSSGEILISIDGDCVVDKGAIENFVEHFRNPTVMAAVGNVKIGNTKTILGLIQYLEFLFSFYCKKADSLLNTIYIIGGAAGAYRREVFETLGGYNSESITEDIDLSVRIQDAGYKIVYAANAIVHTEGATELRGLGRQRLRWKRGRFQTFSENLHLFFSVRRKHSKFLTVVMLPLALFAELQLLLEFGFLTFLYIYAFFSNDYSSFVSGIVVVSFIFMVQMLFDDKETRTWGFLMLAPIAWLLFYVMTFVETNALLRSIWGYLRGKEVVWQQWQRRGVHN